MMKIEEYIYLLEPHRQTVGSGLLIYFAFVCHGFIPCAPKRPGIVITLHTMDIFHATTLCCPQMSVQGFVQTLWSIREQFSICYDVYIAILEGVEHQIMKNLSHEDVDWCLKNCCSACTFELEGEAQMEFSMFRAMDGNDLLKRVPRSKLVESLDGGRVSIEREDTWDGGRSYVLSRSMVDIWSKEAIGDVDAPLPDEITPCEEHWKNMSDDRLGYDIGCKFCGTVNQSPLGELARHKKLRVLVGLFHGHTHNRLCLEDLETLEPFFSKLNMLAGVIQYASRFHHCQRITWYLKHIDCFESFEHLKIIKTYPALQKSMCELGIEDEKEFDLWLKEVYLSGLQREPPEETVEMEYFSRLGQGSSKSKGLMETAQRQLLEKQLQELEHLQDLEQSLNISPDEHWTVGCAKWIENEQRVAMQTYHQHLDCLESLVISRIFELTKMNMLHTVVEYAFLSDFDLLHDVQQDMSRHKWATPAGHKAMDTYFKICCAKEEIKRLNIEIRCVITYMHVEDAYLQRYEKSTAITSPALALQVSHY
ncbi:hypothetical protein IW261DRAFT_1551930 [Armillaria novae-zelandiae]|uniref:Uncharacterized protein n=1 Tax=Armillaria novae-zelandiae TaxID=153914 RepID=A0AA39P4X9_9AGAR|nr:hypothetical protein IW261DRAFT_1551930 [Armillaria novae-zelandiae]